jgi:hypothetical protein
MVRRPENAVGSQETAIHLYANQIPDYLDEHGSNLEVSKETQHAFFGCEAAVAVCTVCSRLYRSSRSHTVVGTSSETTGIGIIIISGTKNRRR